MSARTDVVYALGADIARSVHGLADAHGANAHELITAHASALVGLAFTYSAGEEEFKRLSASIASSIVKAACDPTAPKINVGEPVAQ